jgi:thiamine-phosphate pyrophosphorylase
MDDGLARRARLARSRLYFVTDPIDDDRLAAALRGGVDIVQLRDKDLRDDGLVAAGGRFARVCAAHGALFVLNDRPELVERCGADGVHVGQGDTPVGDARRLVGDARLVGLSTHSRDEMAAAEGADYIGVGTIFPTPTKPGNDAAGLELVRAARYAARVPWFAIGGIDHSNIADVSASGAWGVAVVRAIRDADDPEAAARALRDALPTTEAVVTDGDVLLPHIEWLRATNGRASPHTHAEHLDVFHVLEGTLECRAGDGTVRVPAGSTVGAPPLLVHGFRNPSDDEDATYLNLHAPGGWARGKQAGLPPEEYDTFGAERGSAQARPIVSAPGDGDRLQKPHRLAIAKVDRPELAVLEYFVDAEYDGADSHVHLRHTDCFHVLEGALEFRVDGREVRAEAGTTVIVPPGVVHEFTSAAPRVRFLNVHAPSCGFVEYMRSFDAGLDVDEAQYDSYDWSSGSNP